MLNQPLNCPTFSYICLLSDELLPNEAAEVTSGIHIISNVEKMPQ